MKQFLIQLKYSEITISTGAFKSIWKDLLHKKCRAIRTVQFNLGSLDCWVGHLTAVTLLFKGKACDIFPAWRIKSLASHWIVYCKILDSPGPVDDRSNCRMTVSSTGDEVDFCCAVVSLQDFFVKELLAGIKASSIVLVEVCLQYIQYQCN